MKKINPHFLFSSVLLAILIFALSNRMFDVFPLGEFLNPFTGALQDGAGDEQLNSIHVNDKLNLKDSVHVYFDERRVPHIFANNSDDLFFTQGYVTASFRLWQMDFLTYVAAGRLSEIMGNNFLDNDRLQRRRGILDAAEKSLALIEKDPEVDRVLTNYTNGVNAYISQLSNKDLPVEYKALDYRPEPWTKLKSVLIMKYMAQVLSGFEEDISMTNLMLALGEDDFNLIYPDFHPHVSSITGHETPFGPAEIPRVKKPDYLDYSFMSSQKALVENIYNPAQGSNNWVVSGKKTKSGNTILCNDPHLNMSLPAIWIEMQLSSPGMNVYGVAIPGTPAITIGFNNAIAWGTTNGTTDVKDWYKIKVNQDYTKYELDGEWKELKYRVEEIKVRGRPAFLDTVYYTVHGPIVMDEFYNTAPEFLNLALHWELHRPSNEFATFIRLNKAATYAEYRDAIASYSCPVQNFIFAGKDTISINHRGAIAKKKNGQGRFILDGKESACLYSGYIPDDSLPHVLNPACGYVFSANQLPTNPGYPYYYNGYFSDVRANRINKLLSNDSAFDIARMEAMQLDNVNELASDALPYLTGILDTLNLAPSFHSKLRALMGWNGSYDSNSPNPLLFELWWGYIAKYTWDELSSYSFYSAPPRDYILLGLLKNDPGNKYFDKQGTSQKENAADIIKSAFLTAVTEYEKNAKEGRVTWGDYNKVDIRHMTKLGAFSVTQLPCSGSPHAINAVTSSSGPSWRMIVELGERPKAVGIFPGGESGRAGSRYYDDFVNDWQKGKYYPLNYYLSPSEASQNPAAVWILK